MLGSCPIVNMHCSSSSKHLCILCTGAPSRRPLPILTFMTVRKIHPAVPAAVCMALFSKQELTAYNVFSMLSSEPSPDTQSSTRGHTKRIVDTWLLLLSCLVMFNSLRPSGLQQARLPCPSTFSWTLLKLMFIESVMPSNHLTLCRPLLSFLQSFPASRSFLMSRFCIRWPKYWKYTFSISPSTEYSGLISFRID